MTRNVTVLIESTQSRYDFQTDATTLGELKAQLDSKNVVFSHDNVFKEARSKTTLTSDESILPSNIPFRGGITNDLVFLCTTPQHKIKQGCETRAELYELVKSLNGLAEFIKRNTGKNYTVVSNADLSELVHEFESTSTAETPKKTASSTKTVEVINLDELRELIMSYRDPVIRVIRDSLTHLLDEFLEDITAYTYDVEIPISDEESNIDAYNEAVNNSDFDF